MADPILIVDDDADVRDSLRALLESAGFDVRDFDSAKAILADGDLTRAACLIADIRMPDMDGLALQEELVHRKIGLPVIIVTGHGDVPLAVRAMKAGAVEFLTKPFKDDALLDAIRSAIERSRAVLQQESEMQSLRSRYGALTPREREVMALVCAGLLNKQVGGELGISEITVKAHRGQMMRKMRADSLPELVTMAARLGLAGARSA